MKLEVSANFPTMIPAEQTATEEKVEVPESTQEPTEPEIQEETLDQPKEAGRAATEKDDDGETIKDKEEPQQSPPVNFKYKV